MSFQSNILTYHHEPLFTSEQALKVSSTIPGAKCKNLFLKDSKSKLYLLVAIHDTAIHLKKLSKFIKAPELRFASPELLKEYLGVEPGSVTPFGLINDAQRAVTIILDAKLLEYEYAGFHPLVNTATTVILVDDFKKLIEFWNNNSLVINFSEVEST